MRENKFWFYKDDYTDYTLYDVEKYIKFHNLKKIGINKLNQDIESQNIYQIYARGDISEEIINRCSDL